MQKSTLGRCCMLALISMAPAFTVQAQTVKLPLSDFLTTQGQTSDYFSPVPDLLGWAEALCISGGLNCLTPPYDGVCMGKFVWVDYAGVADHYIVSSGGQSSGTATDGFVMRRRLANGRDEITVSLHTRNALTFVVAPTDLIPGAACAASVNIYGPLLLGARANTLPLPSLSQRALGDSFFHVTFQNDAGAPLPDLVDLFNNRFSDIEEYSFHAVANGPMPGGQHGTVTVQQAGKGSRSNWQPAVVNLRQTGK